MSKQIETPCPQLHPKDTAPCGPAAEPSWWERGNEFASGLLDAGLAELQGLGQRATDAADDGSDLFWNTVELATSGAERVGSGLQAGGDFAQRAIETGRDTAWQGVESTRDFAQQGIEAGGEAAWQGVESARELAHQGIETGRDAAWQGAQATRDLAEQGIEAGQSLPGWLIELETQRRHAIADDPEVKAAVRWAGRDIPSQDIIYEQLAHNLAYGRGDAAQLASWGYDTPLVEIPLDPITGMYAVSVHPLPDLTPQDRREYRERFGQELTSVLCFRGSEDAIDWIDDLQPEAVGAIQFVAHRADIARSLARCSGPLPPDTTGHSLGGALAQLAATLGAVRRIVTFQAPGIPPSFIERVPEDVKATHHRGVNDWVGWSGGQHLDGDVYLHHTTQFDLVPVASHTHFLMGGLNDLRGGVVPNLADQFVYQGAAYVTKGEAQAMGASPTAGGGGQGALDDGGEAMRVPARLSGLDPAAMGDLQGRNGRGETSRTLAITGAAPDWDGDGQAGMLEQGYAAGRAWVAEQGRAGAGRALNATDRGAELASDMTGEHIPGGGELFGEQMSRNVTKGRDLGARGAEMRRFMAASQEYERRLVEGLRREREEGVVFDFGAMEEEVEDAPELELQADLRGKLIKNLRWKARSWGHVYGAGE